ncbi:MAG: hypothetical protein ABJN36_17410 [Cyclobacteriaceae bacterium]
MNKSFFNLRNHFCFSSCLIISICFSGCSGEASQPNSIDKISGSWFVHTAILDGSVQEDWHLSLFQFDVMGSSQIQINRIKKNDFGLKIWPTESSLTMVSNEGGQEFVFERNDGVKINFLARDGGTWEVNLHPPRNWSYNEDCTTDSLKCSEEGDWYFYFEDATLSD